MFYAGLHRKVTRAGKLVRRGLLILALLVVGLVPAAPAFAIHDPNVPAGDCSVVGADVGIPSTDEQGVLLHRDLSFSNSVLADVVPDFDAPCAND
jgi:hypothetical protein